MRSFPRTALSVLAAALLLPAAGDAATLGPVRTLGDPHTGIAGLRSLPGTPSSLTALWSFSDGAGTEPDGLHAASRPYENPTGPAVSFGAEYALPRELSTVRGYQHTGLMAIGQRLLSGGAETARFSVRTAIGHVGRGATESTLFTGTTALAPELAVNETSRALAAFVEIRGRKEIIKVSQRDPHVDHGRFSSPSTLVGTGQAQAISVAVGNRGDEVLAFVRGRHVEARVRRASHHWGSIRRLASADVPTKYQLRTAVDSRGRVQVLWRRDELGGQQRTRLETAYMPVGRFTFRTAPVVEADGAGEPSALVTTPTGFAVAYAQRTDQGIVPRVRRLSPRPGPAIDVAPRAAGVRDVALDDPPVAGAETVSWIQPDAAGVDTGYVVVVSPSASVPPTAPVSTPAEHVSELVAQTDPLVGTIVLVWTAHPRDGDPFVVHSAEVRRGG